MAKRADAQQPDEDATVGSGPGVDLRALSGALGTARAKLALSLVDGRERDLVLPRRRRRAACRGSGFE
jgi:hypothetical protein